ncbi:MAG: hypothetical protein RJA70_3098 [Pseudomonadota bacterium]
MLFGLLGKTRSCSLASVSPVSARTTVGSTRPGQAPTAVRSALPGTRQKLSAGVAQLVEHLLCKQAVRGSSPLPSSTLLIPPLSTSLLQTSYHPDSEGCPSGQWEQAVNLPASAFVGSNPTPSTKVENIKYSAGVAQLVERQPSKLNVASSSLVSRSEPFNSLYCPHSSGGRARPW